VLFHLLFLEVDLQEGYYLLLLDSRGQYVLILHHQILHLLLVEQEIVHFLRLHHLLM
tara:strand:+ start:260 stop:430 length:171 start_codon:yes stop_codon:yes gene_type:complete